MEAAGARTGRIGGCGRAPLLLYPSPGGEAKAFVPLEVAAAHGIDRVPVRGQIHRVLLLIPRPQP